MSEKLYTQAEMEPDDEFFAEKAKELEPYSRELARKIEESYERSLNRSLVNAELIRQTNKTLANSLKAKS